MTYCHNYLVKSECGDTSDREIWTHPRVYIYNKTVSQTPKRYRCMLTKPPRHNLSFSSLAPASVTSGTVSVFKHASNPFNKNYDKPYAVLQFGQKIVTIRALTSRNNTLIFLHCCHIFLFLLFNATASLVQV